MTLEENIVRKRLVYCLNCRHEFISRVKNPRCNKCGHLKFIDSSEIPRKRTDDYFTEEIDKLKKQVDELSACVDGIMGDLKEDLNEINGIKNRLDAVENRNKGVVGQR